MKRSNSKHPAYPGSRYGLSEWEGYQLKSMYEQCTPSDKCAAVLDMLAARCRNTGGRQSGAVEALQTLFDRHLGDAAPFAGVVDVDAELDSILKEIRAALNGTRSASPQAGRHG